MVKFSYEIVGNSGKYTNRKYIYTSTQNRKQNVFQVEQLLHGLWHRGATSRTWQCLFSNNVIVENCKKKKKLKKGTKTLLQHKRETRSIFQKKNVSVQYKIIFTELINMTLTCYKQKFEIQKVLISILINHQGNNITSLNDLDIILVVAQNLLCQQNSAKKQSNAEFRFRVFALIYLWNYFSEIR